MEVGVKALMQISNFVDKNASIWEILANFSNFLRKWPSSQIYGNTDSVRNKTNCTMNPGIYFLMKTNKDYTEKY